MARLLTLATEYPPARGYGLARYASSLSCALVARGHNIHVVTGNYTQTDSKRSVGTVNVHGLLHRTPLRHFHWVGDAVLGNVWLLDRALEVVDEHGPFDAVLTHDWLGALAAKSLAAIHSMPLVLFMHDTEPGKRKGTLSRSQCYITEMERWACDHADAVIANSSFLADELKRVHVVPDRKLHIAACGVDSAQFETDCDSADFRDLLARADERLILYAGRLSPVKGVDLLVEAMPHILERHPTTRLMLAGDGALREPLEQRAMELGISGLVTFAGYLRGAPLGAAYRAADLVVVPSRYEPFGMVALEAMACGTPVHVADVGGLREIVPDKGAASRFPPGDADALTEAVCQILAKGPTATQREKLRQHAALYTWERTAQTVTSVCDKLLRE